VRQERDSASCHAPVQPTSRHANGDGIEREGYGLELDVERDITFGDVDHAGVRAIADAHDTDLEAPRWHACNPEATLGIGSRAQAQRVRVDDDERLDDGLADFVSHDSRDGSLGERRGNGQGQRRCNDDRCRSSTPSTWKESCGQQAT
jgi:hypothetical protein